MAQQDELKVAHCTVVCLDIVAYANQPVAVQVLLKERLCHLLRQALVDVPDEERIVWDSTSGVVISFLGEIEGTVAVLRNVQQMLHRDVSETEPVLQLYIAVNQGPVRLLCSDFGFPELVGDGVSVAQNIMQLADENQILLSASYCDALSKRCPVYHKYFQYLGMRTDYAVRSHELYILVEPLLQVETSHRRMVPVVYMTLCMALFLMLSMASVLQRTQEQYDIALVVTDAPALSPVVKPRHAVSEAPALQAIALADVQVAPVGLENPAKPTAKEESHTVVSKHEEQPAAEVVHENITPTETAQTSTPHSLEGDNREGYIAVLCDKGTGVFVDGMSKGRITHTGLTMGMVPGKHFVIVSHSSGNLYPQHVDVEPGKTLFIKPEICS